MKNTIYTSLMKLLIIIILISFTFGISYPQELIHYTAANGLSGTDVTPFG